MGDLVATAASKVNIENEQVRVTTWSFRSEERTGLHTHEFPYVVVPLTPGRLRLETSSGVETSELAEGACYFRDRGTQHDVVNDGSDSLVFVEIELKACANPQAAFSGS